MAIVEDIFHQYQKPPVNWPQTPEQKPKEISLSEIPPFLADDLEIWFHQVESVFSVHHIKLNKTKFELVFAKLDAEHAKQVKDLIINKQPEQWLYVKLKEKLLNYEAEKLKEASKKLFSVVEIDKLTPKQIFESFKKAASTKIPESFIVSEWMEYLPIKIHYILKSMKNQKTEVLLDLADRIYNCLPKEDIPAAIANCDFQMVYQKISKMKQQIDNLNNEFNALMELIPLKTCK